MKFLSKASDNMLQKCTKCQHCLLFDIYYAHAGVYWYIQSLVNLFQIKITIHTTDGFLIKEIHDLPKNKKISLGIDEKKKISKLTMDMPDLSFVVQKFNMICTKCSESICNSNQTTGSIVCGCFDGLTLKHNRLLKYAVSLGSTIIYVDPGSQFDTKHHSSFRFMNSLKERMEAVRLCIIGHCERFGLKLKHSISIRPRYKKMRDSIQEAQQEFFKRGFNKIYYVCGSDQMEFIIRKRKLPLGPPDITPFDIERNPVEIEKITKNNFPSILNRLDLSILSDYPLLTSDSWFSSTILRKYKALMKRLDQLGIDRPNDKQPTDKCNPLWKSSKTSTLYEFLHVGFHNKWNELDIRTRIGKLDQPLKLAPKMMRLVSDIRMVLCLPGRSSKLSKSSICREFQIGLETIQQTGKQIRFFTVDYDSRDIPSMTWLKHMYAEKNGLYFNQDACRIMMNVIAPRFSESLCRIKGRFYGQKISIKMAREKLSKLTIFARSLGTAMSHMISGAMECAMLAIGFTKEEVRDLIQLVVSLDFGNIVNPEHHLCKFCHVKFQGHLDDSAQKKLNEFLPLRHRSPICEVQQIRTLEEPFIETPNGLKTFKTIPKHKIPHKNHMSLAYIGKSDLKEDQETTEFIKKKIQKVINR